jgi:hypothetical protein
MAEIADDKPPQDLRAISLNWENETGYDSIETIERLYARSASGAYCCVWPHCSFARHDAVALWRHVHTAHGKSSLPTDVR